MKNQITLPTLASREYVALPCVTEMPATDRRGIDARGAAWGTDGTEVLLGDARRVRSTGKHTGFAHSAGSLTWSPPI